MAQPPLLTGSAHARAVTLVERCGGGREKAGEWQVRCPAHDDAHPSLSIGVKDDKVVLHCHAGCATDAVLATLGVTMGELWVPQPRLQRRIVATYDYHDADGRLLYQVVRLSPKTFRQRRPDPDQPGAYLWDLGGIAPVLYHLPEVMHARDAQVPIYIVEGEKDADTLRAQGVVATCNPMGAGKWRSDYTATLVGADVIVLPDHDVAGRRHATVIAQALVDVAQSVKLIEHFHTETKGSDITDWFTAGGTREEFEALVTQAPLFDAPRGEAAPVGWSYSGVPGTTITTQRPLAEWTKDLFAKSKGKELTQNVYNLMQILGNHPRWLEPDDLLWWDSVRGVPMRGAVEVTDAVMIDIATWCGEAMRLPITSPRLLEQCVIAQCKKQEKDLLQIWLNSLEPWDGTPRLTTWLTDVAGLTMSDYVADVSRVLPVSMVARALVPGCHYRFVVILEGPENMGKSSLVRELASPDWFVELSMGLETKEAHMMLQGAWVAELPDLDSMTRTEEARMKAFITMRQDSYIPKYSNFRQRTARRTVFIGTTNDETYLKGLSGNTRYLPLRLDHPLDIPRFLALRTALFAEALAYYYAHPETWWLFSDEALATATEEREQRRVLQVYEHPLHEWLEQTRFTETYLDQGLRVQFLKDETTWMEIAQYFLKLDTPEKWKDRSLQMQIAASLKGLGWEVRQVWRSGRNMNVWRKPSAVPF